MFQFKYSDYVVILCLLFLCIIQQTIQTSKQAQSGQDIKAVKNLNSTKVKVKPVKSKSKSETIETDESFEESRRKYVKVSAKYNDKKIIKKAVKQKEFSKQKNLDRLIVKILHEYSQMDADLFEKRLQNIAIPRKVGSAGHRKVRKVFLPSFPFFLAILFFITVSAYFRFLYSSSKALCTI